MVNTVKTRRPTFPRRPDGPGGRVEHDALGNAIWMRTRTSDPTALPDTSALSLADDPPVAADDGRAIERQRNLDGPPIKPKPKS
jgi:hypothetical protein